MASARSGIVGLRRVAIHEAGHAVVALSLGLELAHVSVEGNRADGSLGRAVCPGLRQAPAQDRVTLLWAGPFAERRAYPRADALDVSDLQDIAEAIEGVAYRAADGRARPQAELQAEFMDACRRRAAAIVEREWAAISRLADALMQARRLTGAEVLRIRADAARRPVVTINAR